MKNISLNWQLIYKTKKWLFHLYTEDLTLDTPELQILTQIQKHTLTIRWEQTC